MTIKFRHYMYLIDLNNLKYHFRKCFELKFVIKYFCAFFENKFYNFKECLKLNNL